MDVEHLIGSVIQGTLLGSRKRSRGARRFLQGGGNPFLNASTLLTVGGLVWGAIETMQQQSAGQPSGAAGAAHPPLPAPPAAPPPIPASAAPSSDHVDADAAAGPEVPEGALKLVRLAISAARADGALDEKEQQAILEHARGAGAEALVGRELQRPTSLAAIVEGITDPQQRADLYVLAYAIVRADETVSGSERIYLAQLASLLDLDRATVERLEGGADVKIAAESTDATRDGPATDL